MSPWIDAVEAAGTFGPDAAALEGRVRGQLAGRLAPLPDDPRADVSPLADYVPKARLRRCDHLTRLALLAACRCLEAAGRGPDESTGLVLATGHGPLATNNAFLDSLLSHGAPGASPTAFSHSVHNIPAATICLLLGLTGPAATLCQFETAAAAGLALAEAWLAEGRVSRVLFVGADEFDPAAAEAEELALGVGAPGPRGEGAAAMLLSAAPGPGSAARIKTFFGPRTGRADVCCLGPGALRAGETRGLDLSPVRGVFATASLLDAAAAALGALGPGRVACVEAGPDGQQAAVLVTPGSAR